MLELTRKYKYVILIAILLMLGMSAQSIFIEESESITLMEIEDKKADEVCTQIDRLVMGVDTDTVNQQEETSLAQLPVTASRVEREMQADEMSNISTTWSENEIINEMKLVPIYICGQVISPGVYNVPITAILDDVIKVCGGLTEEADLLQINLAEPITPHQKIYIPKEGEEIDKTLYSYDNIKAQYDTQKTNISGQEEEAMQGELININTADEKKLCDLPGIGPAKAEAIINYRETHGSFSSIDELTNVDGIADKTLEKLKSRITI